MPCGGDKPMGYMGKRKLLQRILHMDDVIKYYAKPPTSHQAGKDSPLPLSLPKPQSVGPSFYHRIYAVQVGISSGDSASIKAKMISLISAVRVVMGGDLS